jgi:hypothetical protein
MVKSIMGTHATRGMISRPLPRVERVKTNTAHALNKEREQRQLRVEMSSQRPS